MSSTLARGVDFFGIGHTLDAAASCRQHGSNLGATAPRYATYNSNDKTMGSGTGSRYESAESDCYSAVSGSTNTPTVASAVFSNAASHPSTGRTTSSVITRNPPHLLVGNAHLIPPAYQELFCGFVHLHECDQTFAFDETRAWIDHQVDGHLENTFPRQVLCWFCDEVPFIARNRSDRRDNFTTMLEHVRGHIFDDHYALDQLRIDHNLVRHMYKKGLLDEETYQRAMAYSEPAPGFPVL